MDTLFNLITKDPNLLKLPKTEPDKRLEFIRNDIFIQVYYRLANSLLNNDKLIFKMARGKIQYVILNCGLDF